MSPPSQKEFEQSLSAYRDRWPQEGYFNTWERFVETYKRLQDYYQGGRIVDVGGWPGDFSCCLASLQFEVLLLDKDLARPTKKVHDAKTNTWVLDGATRLLDRCQDYGVNTVQCDIERDRIPLDDASTDFIIFTEVLEHLRVGLLHALRELRRILKPGGRLLLTTPNLLSLQNRLSFLVGRASYDTLEMPYDALHAEERIGHGGHFRVFSMPELVDLLERMGFRLLHRSYQHLLNTDGQKAPWSLYALRMGMLNRMARWVPPARNTLFLVMTRD